MAGRISNRARLTTQAPHRMKRFAQRLDARRPGSTEASKGGIDRFLRTQLEGEATGIPEERRKQALEKVGVRQASHPEVLEALEHSVTEGIVSRMRQLERERGIEPTNWSGLVDFLENPLEVAFIDESEAEAYRKGFGSLVVEGKTHTFCTERADGAMRKAAREQARDKKLVFHESLREARSSLLRIFGRRFLEAAVDRRAWLTPGYLEGIAKEKGKPVPEGNRSLGRQLAYDPELAARVVGEAVNEFTHGPTPNQPLFYAFTKAVWDGYYDRMRRRQGLEWRKARVERLWREHGPRMDKLFGTGTAEQAKSGAFSALERRRGLRASEAWRTGLKPRVDAWRERPRAPPASAPAASAPVAAPAAERRAGPFGLSGNVLKLVRGAIGLPGLELLAEAGVEVKAPKNVNEARGLAQRLARVRTVIDAASQRPHPANYLKEEISAGRFPKKV